MIKAYNVNVVVSSVVPVIVYADENTDEEDLERIAVSKIDPDNIDFGYDVDDISEVETIS